MPTARSGRRGPAIQSALVLALFTLTPDAARAGDPPAHQEAARRASLAVAAQFPNGVGSPTYQIDPNAVWNGSSPVGETPVNIPDLWGCTESSQPPALTVANDQIVGPLTAHLASALNLAAASFGSYEIAMTCNYNHFVENGALSGAASTGDVVRVYDSYLYPTSADCSVAGWNTYWTHVLNGLHFVQDSVAEQHEVGNRWCSDSSPALGRLLGGGDIGTVASFLKTSLVAGVTGRIVDDSCMDFMASGLGAWSAGDLSCDGAVSPGIVAVLQGACLGGMVPVACMGLERVLRHHCFYTGDRATPRLVHCSGLAAPACSNPNATCRNPPSTFYCEGELCLGGGTVDFTTDATNVSIPYLTKWAQEWAVTCGCGGHPCEAPSVCLNCGQGDSCAAAGSQCCGATVCSSASECCSVNGAPTCVPTGSCCGATTCGAGEVCQDCSQGTGPADAGASDAGPDSTCPPAIPPGLSDAGGVSRPGTCVAKGTSCPDSGVDSGVSCLPLGAGCTSTSQCCPAAGVECGIVNGGGMACAGPPGTACTSNNECSFGTLDTEAGAGIVNERNNQCYDGGCCVQSGDCVLASDCCNATSVCQPGAPWATLGCCQPAGAPCLQWNDQQTPGDCCGNQRCDPTSHTCVCAGTGANCWGTMPGCCNGTCPGDGNGCP